MTEVEKWRAMVGFPGYEISSFGRVRCWRPVNRVAKAPTTPRILRIKVSPDGYEVLSLRTSGRRTVTVRIHRAMLEAFVGPCPPNMEGCHNDGVRRHNRLHNLRWDTRLENTQDSFRHGTHMNITIRGVAKYNSKLTESDVVQIREKLKQGVPQRTIAKSFGIGQGTVCSIKSGRSWGHI